MAAKRLQQEAVDEPMPDSFTIFKKHGCLAQSIMYDIHPSFVDEQSIRYLQEHYVTKPNEVYIITTPKSGTTWVQKICLEIMNAQREVEIPKFQDGNWRHIVWKEAFLSQSGRSAFDAYRSQFAHSLCFWKTHASYHAFPAKNIDPSTKLIVVCRNPKDTVVSAYNFFRVEPASKFTGNFNDYFKYWMMGMMIFGSWFEFYSEWYRAYKYKNQQNNILWIYYEDLQQAPLREIEKIARFIGRYDGLEKTETRRKQKIQQIEQRCSFQSMKQLTDSKVVEIGVGSQFFRKGIVNDWKNWMTQRQSDLVDNMIRCKFYESDFKYYMQLKTESSTPQLPLSARL